jgi:hypothetical protein
MDFATTGQKIVQRVATCAGDHQKPIGGSQLEGNAIKRGIFPTGVVKQVVAVNCMKYAGVQSFPDGVGHLRVRSLKEFFSLYCQTCSWPIE